MTSHENYCPQIINTLTMKILKKFVLANLTFNPVTWKYQFSESALQYLTKNKKLNRKGKGQITLYRSIDLTSASRGSEVDKVRAILYAKNRVDESFIMNPLILKIDWEFKNCFGHFKKYFADFQTFKLSEEQAHRKAVTVCLLSVIKKYWDAGNHPELIYRTLCEQKTQGEINCNSLPKFYAHIRLILKSGIYAEVLMGETRW